MVMSDSEKVIRTLYEITAEKEHGFSHQVYKLLSLGCERFGLSIGIVSRVEGDKYEVMYKLCPDEIPLKEGDVFELGRTYCAVTLSAYSPLCIEHVKRSDLSSHPAYKDFGLEAYIGVPIRVNGEVYGTLNFTNPEPYKDKFRDIDIDALQLMSSWIGAELASLEQLKELEQANKKLQELADRDWLTKLFNRRSFQEQLQHHLHLANRTGQPLSLALVDVDFFKNYNDQYGHLEGDDALKTISDLLQKNSRNSDIIARFGGEEFAVLMPNTDESGAIHVCTLLQETLGDYDWSNRALTVSMGLSTIRCHKIEPEKIVELVTRVIKEADDALYYAKRNGRSIFFHYADIA